MRINYPRNHAMKSLRSTARSLSLISALGVFAACELPTESPRIEQDWTFPLTTLDVGVVELLPSGIGVNEDTTAFTVQVEGVDFEETLADLCDGCQGLDGLTVPKPAFQGMFEETFPLPDDIESAVVQEGEVEIEARNGFGFDPLRPPGGATGTVTLALRDGGPTGTILDQVVLDGTNTSFGPGTVLTRTLSYSGPIGSSLTVTVNINSPAGGAEPGNWVPIRLADRLEVDVDPGLVEASAAEVSVENRLFGIPTTDLDVEAIDKDLVDRIERGSVVLKVQNPWSVPATFNMAINGPTMPAPVNFIARVPASATSEVSVEFSTSDLKSFLGEEGVILGGQGTVDPGSGSVTLSPTQVMTVKSELAISIIIG